MSAPARLTIEPRGLQREIAARYVGVSPTKFDEMVSAGLMPKPKHVARRKIWDRFALDAAFEELPDDGEAKGNWFDRRAAERSEAGNDR